MTTLADSFPIPILRLGALDPALLTPLIAESERAGFRFVRRLGDDCAAGVNRFDAPGEALFGAFDAASRAMVGVAGLNVDPYAPAELRAGRVRHLYVAAASRRARVGRRLMAAVADAARAHGFALLTLRTDTPEAAAFYRALGFTEDDSVPGASHWLRLTTAEGDGVASS